MRKFTEEDYLKVVTPTGIRWKPGQPVPNNSTEITTWLCACGGEFQTYLGSIRSDNRVGCKVCSHKQKGRNRLTLEDYQRAKNKNGVIWKTGQNVPQNTYEKTIWICSCGKEFTSNWTSIMYSNSQCGCTVGFSKDERIRRREERLKDSTVNNILVLEPTNSLLKPLPNGKLRTTRRWLCLCFCGNKFSASETRLINKTIKSCGCKKEKVKRRLYTNNKYVGAKYYNSIKNRALLCNREFNITPEYIEALLIEQNFICKLSGEKIAMQPTGVGHTASLDRIDSKKGYIEGNVQWVHTIVNSMKNDMDQGEFLELCKLVAKHRKPTNG